VPQDAREQAREFIAALRTSGATLPAAVDVERAENEAATGAEVHQALSDFRAEFFAEMGYVPAVYTSHGEWTGWGLPMTGDPSFATSDLWLADYEAMPHPPSPWASCVMHQYTGTGTCDGVPGKVDHSRFQGSETDFRAWAGIDECPETDPAPPSAA
jgi:GH25 family lysozyme M1 (1,4-beta-N-acetylmuramidase)